MKQPSSLGGISLFYGLVLSSMVVTAGAQTPIQVAADTDSIAQGDSLLVQVIVGSEEEPVADLYGIGFRLTFDPAVFHVSDGEAGSFWDGREILEFSLVDSSAGFAAYSITLIEDPGVDGHGVLSTFRANARPDAPLGYTMLALEEIEGIDSGGAPLAFIAQADSIDVIDDISAVDTATESRNRDSFFVSHAPNPTRGGTGRIRFQAPQGRSLRLGLFDVQGRRIRRILATQNPSPSGLIPWNGRDDRGRPISPGIYYLRLETEHRTAQTPVVLAQ